jgi:enterochelin esterase-like enzyme
MTMRKVRGKLLGAAILLAGNFQLVEAGSLCNHGQVLEGLSFPSNLVEKSVNYAIYLPPDYDLSKRRYPVVYLLHGFTDDETAWIQFGEANQAADMAISRSEVPPMIIVMPDGGITWYINDFRSQTPYERMLIEEFIPHIDSVFRTRPVKEFRAVSGLSMGGFGSLMLAMRHPDLFASCAAFSSGVHTDAEITEMSDERYDRLFTDLYGDHLRGSERLTAHFREYNPLHLAQSVSPEELKKVRWYIDCGDDDFLYRGNAALHVLLRELEIPHEFRVRDGAHNWTYWRTHVIEGLRFLGEGFHR